MYACGGNWREMRDRSMILEEKLSKEKDKKHAADSRRAKTDESVKKCTVGGQALLGGIMMKSPEHMAVSIRKESGEIVTTVEDYTPWHKKKPFFGVPIVRGCINFVESLAVGMKTMSYAAEALELEEEEPGKFELWLSKTFGKSIEQVIIGVAMVLAIGLSVLLFIALPSFISSMIGRFLPALWIKNVAEGVLRLLVFFGYLVAVSRMKDIKAVFRYHGAEHKTIACYEHDLPLTVENARAQQRLHPRCGTNYLFLVMMISILFFSLIGFDGHWAVKIALRIALLPVVAGISYEVLRLAGLYENWLTRIVRWPGLQLQRITTAEPDDGQLEVAIAAFEMALNPEEVRAREMEKQSADIESEQADESKKDKMQGAATGEAITEPTVLSSAVTEGT